MRRNLPKLAPACYRGTVTVHWILGIKARKTGWLDQVFHLRFRELLVHTCVRESLICPAYCLMPDHVHLLLWGSTEDSDQRAAMKLLRQEFARLLPPGMQLQHQTYDHILRDKETSSEAFPTVVDYIFRNPCRKELCGLAHEWPFAGSMAPGYPVFDLRTPESWTLFEKRWFRP